MQGAAVLRKGVCRIVAMLAAAFVSTMVPAEAQAQTVTAEWDPSPLLDLVTGYQVCIGSVSLTCNVRLASVSAPTTRYTFSPTPGTLTFVATRAVNLLGVSPYSNEVRFSIPAFAQPANQTSKVGVAISPVSLAVSDPDGGRLSFTHVGLPVGLTLNGTTGQITGTPATSGTFNVTLFVNDGIVTVSRALTWTVTSSSSDTLAPSLTVSSPTPGQTLSTASITVSGTATDSGRGGSGITGVRVNGVAASGGTATGSNTANWSRSISLVSGSNTITVDTTDGAGNSSMQQFTVNYASSSTASTSTSISAVTNASITADLASPRSVGTAITFTGSASGGVTPRQFKFVVKQGSGSFQTVRAWSSTNTYTWTPTVAAAYTIAVWVRSAGVTTDAAQASAQMSYSATVSPGVNVVSATPNSGSGYSRTFSFVFTESRGSQYLSTAWVWFRLSLCKVYYDRALERVYLLQNEAGTAWSSGTVGSSTVLGNGFCSISLASSSVLRSGSLLTLNLTVSFGSAAQGTSKGIWMYANTIDGYLTGWVQKGTWSVP